MAGLQDEQKRQAGVVAPSGRINRLPNAPQNNPLAQIDPAVRQAGMNLQNQQAAQPLAHPQTALMQRQSPQMQAFAQGQQQQQQRMNAALAANGGRTLNPQQARAALGQQGEAARALGAHVGQRYRVADTAQNALAQPPNPQGWGKTAYGDKVVGRKTDDGYAFSNQTADVQAAGSNRFKGRGGADGRVSDKGSFNTMSSENMWRDLGGSNPLAQIPAAPARYGKAERLPDSLQNIRSNGVNVVKSGADERNAQLKLRWQGEELIRQGKNTRRARGSQQMVQAGTQMLSQAAAQPFARAAADEAKAQQGAELESRERMSQGRQALEQAQAAALEQQTQSAQAAQQAQQQQAQRLQQMQQLLADPNTSPQQRQLAKQFIDMATFDPKRYTTLKGADNEYGSGGQFVLDLLTGQPIYGGGLGGQGGAISEEDALKTLAEKYATDANGNSVYVHPDGRKEYFR